MHEGEPEWKCYFKFHDSTSAKVSLVELPDRFFLDQEANPEQLGGERIDAPQAQMCPVVTDTHRIIDLGIVHWPRCCNFADSTRRRYLVQFAQQSLRIRGVFEHFAAKHRVKRSGEKFGAELRRNDCPAWPPFRGDIPTDRAPAPFPHHFLARAVIRANIYEGAPNRGCAVPVPPRLRSGQGSRGRSLAKRQQHMRAPCTGSRVSSAVSPSTWRCVSDAMGSTESSSWLTGQRCIHRQRGADRTSTLPRPP